MVYAVICTGDQTTRSGIVISDSATMTVWVRDIARGGDLVTYLVDRHYTNPIIVRGSDAITDVGVPVALPGRKCASRSRSVVFQSCGKTVNHSAIKSSALFNIFLEPKLNITHNQKYLIMTAILLGVATSVSAKPMTVTLSDAWHAEGNRYGDQRNFLMEDETAPKASQNAALKACKMELELTGGDDQFEAVINKMGAPLSLKFDDGSCKIIAINDL